MAVPALLDKHLQYKSADDFFQGRYHSLIEFMRARDKYEMSKLYGNPIEKKWGAQGLEQVFRDLQMAMQSLVNSLNDGSTIRSQIQVKPLIWANEKQRLQNFYHYLKSSQAAFNLCETLCSDVDKQIQLMRGEEEKVGLILKAREQIGKIVFLFDEDSKAIDNIKKNSIKAIENQVKTLLMGFHDRLFGFCEKPEKLCLQEKDSILRNEKLKLIAKCLINSQGKLNLGLITSIESLFFINYPREPYADNLFFALDTMDPFWQECLDVIALNLHPYINDVICADQKVKSDQFTVRVVRQEVLYSVLSQLSYGMSINQYAASWAIKKPQEYIKRIFDDYNSLLQDGCLIRMENGSPERFFFKKTLADKSKNTLKLAEDGLVLEYTDIKDKADLRSGLSFYECQPLINAAWMMGIDLKTRKSDILKLLFPAPHDPKAPSEKSLSWEQLIEVIAGLDLSASDQIEERKSLGKYAFSLSVCRLLQARESALAVMWENRSGDSIRKKLETTVMDIFKMTFDDYQLGMPVYQKVLVEEIKRIFVQTLQDSSRFIYNASTGSFELFQREVVDVRRITTPEEFRKFIFEVIDKTKHCAFEKAKDSFRERGAIQAVVEGMRITARRSDFMNSVLEAHDSLNMKTSDVLANYSKLLRTPMSHKPEKSFLELDPGVDFIPDARTILHNDPRGLLKWMLDLARWKMAVGTLMHKFNIRQTISIDLSNEEFQSFIKGNLSSDEWIGRMLIKPGLDVSNSFIEEETIELFENNIYVFNARIFSKIPVSVLQELQELFKDLNKQRMTVSQYCQRVSAGLISIFRMDDQQKQVMSFVLDSILIEHLPPQQKNVILNGAVRFAKYEGKIRKGLLEGKKGYFCFYFSPILQQIRLGILFDGRKVLRPMDEYSWRGPKKWHAYPDTINEIISQLIAAQKSAC